MKEYKVVGLSNWKKAEQTINEMAVQGWEVVTVTYYYGFITLLITFSRDK